MHHQLPRVAAVCAVLAALVGAPLAAQVTALSGLNFGSILSGTTTSVAATSPDAMSLRIRAILGISGGFTLTMPTTLVRDGGGGTMPVTFCSTCARYRVNNSNPAGATVFNPNAPVSGLTILVLANIYIWVGGSVSPPLNQPPGSYSGTVVLTIAPIL